MFFSLSCSSNEEFVSYYILFLIINFFGLQQELFQIFKLLNLTVINMFKVIKNFLCHSSSLDTETKGAYDNFKSYD